jgi:hypothetical protein
MTTSWAVARREERDDWNALHNTIQTKKNDNALGNPYVLVACLGRRMTETGRCASLRAKHRLRAYLFELFIKVCEMGLLP